MLETDRETPSPRRARAEDAAALASIATAAYSVYLPRMPAGVRPAPLDADYAAAIARDEVWVVELDARVAGFLVLVPEAGCLLLENVAVAPRAQGRGIGGALLDLAASRARERGLPAVRLYTHVTMVENRRLYERRGYVATDRRRTGALERVFFVKPLG